VGLTTKKLNTIYNMSSYIKIKPGHGQLDLF